MTAFFSVLIKDLRVRFSSPLELVFFLALPLVFIMVLSGSSTAPAENGASLVLIEDRVGSESSRELSAAIASLPEIRVRQVSDPGELLRDAKADLMITVRPAASPDGKRPFTVNVRLSPWRGPAAAAERVGAYLSSLGAPEGTRSASAATAVPVPAAVSASYARLDNGASVSVPSEAAMGNAGQIVTWVLVPLLGLGSTFIAERRRGTLRRTRAAPVSSTAVAGGTAAAEVLAALVQIALLVCFGTVALGLPWLAHPLELAAVSVSFCVAGAALGALLGLFCSTERQAGSLGLAVSMVLAILGGCWYPDSYFPAGIRSITRLDPAGWAMRGFLAVLSPEAGVGGALQDAALLTLFAAVVLLATAAVSRLRKVAPV